MPQHIYKKWVPPIESRLPDVHGWLEDMHAAQAFAGALQMMLASESSDPVVIDALSTATLVRYSRCFTTGSRQRLSIEQLETAEASDVEHHERLRGIRDWHVAHPVNLQEVHAVYLIVDPSPEATSGALGVSSLSAADLALSPPDVAATQQLCEKWIAWLTSQLVAENQKIFPLAQSLTRQEVLALPSDEPSPELNIHARRRQRSNNASK